MHLLNELLLVGLMTVNMVQAVIPCTDDAVARRVPGELACYDGDLSPMTCNECNNRPAKTSDGATCIVIKDTDGSFQQTACPGDPAPGPEGPDHWWDGLVAAFCDVQGGGGLIEFPTTFACMEYAYFGGQDEYERNLAGIMSVCDMIFEGLCTMISVTSGADIGGGGSG